MFDYEKEVEWLEYQAELLKLVVLAALVIAVVAIGGKWGWFD